MGNSRLITLVSFSMLLAIGTGYVICQAFGPHGEPEDERPSPREGPTLDSPESIVVQAAPGLRGYARTERGSAFSPLAASGSASPPPSPEELWTPALAEPVPMTFRPEPPKTLPTADEDEPWPGERTRGDAPRRMRASASQKALHWLRAHQAANGSWVPGEHEAWCKGERTDHVARRARPGDPRFTTATTAMAVSAFMIHGYTHRGRHAFKRAVSKGLRWIKGQQTPEGSFGDPAAPYAMLNHVWATLAIVEAYGFTESPLFKGAGRKGLDYLVSRRHADGTWGFGPRGDMILTGLACLAIRNGEVIALDQTKRGQTPWWSPPERVYRAPAILARALTDVRLGETGLTTPGDGVRGADLLPTQRGHDASCLATCLAALVRGFDGATLAENPGFAGLLGFLGRNLPYAPTARSGSPADLMYVALAPLVVPVDRRISLSWQEALFERFVDTQVEAATYCEGLGSFDPVGAWGLVIGRAGTTALAARALCHPIDSYGGRYEMASPQATAAGQR